MVNSKLVLKKKKKSAPRLGKTEKEEDAEENFLFRSNVQ